MLLYHAKMPEKATHRHKRSIEHATCFREARADTLRRRRRIFDAGQDER